jgi:TRAP-type transport system small permease protein
MESLIGGLERILEKVAFWLAQIAVVSTLLLTAVVTYSVIMRFVFNSSQNWADELASYSLLWIVFLGLTYTLTEGAHIRIDFFTVMLSLRLQHYLEVLIWAIGTLFGSLLFLGCLSELRNFIRRGTYSTEGLEIPLFWPASAMVAGSALFTLAMLVRCLRLAVSGSSASQSQEREQHL